MPCLKRPVFNTALMMNKRSSLLIPVTALLLMLQSFLAGAADTHFVVKSAESTLENNSIMLNANLSLQLGDDVLDALDNGVAVTLRFTVGIERYRKHLWNESAINLSQRYRIKIHPLTNRILVVNVNTGLSNDFRELNDALSALSELRGFPLTSSQFLDQGESYLGNFEIDIDIEALPPPMRPAAYFSSDWNTSSDTFQWKINP